MRPLAFLSIPSLAAAQLATRAVSFGQPLPVATLFPAPILDAADVSGHAGAQGFLAQYLHNENPNGLGMNATEHEDIALLHGGGYVPYEITENVTLVRRRDGLVTRAPAYRGVCKMNCKKSPEACKNACYYQNCIMAGRTVHYYEPGANTANRDEAGVSVTLGTPCRTWPFGQRFWDSRKGGATTDLNLQTDEWPMNSMRRDNFNRAATTPQVALRCIPNGDNSRGGGQIKAVSPGPWRLEHGKKVCERSPWKSQQVSTRRLFFDVLLSPAQLRK
ncbi:hypothetical protein BST61_g406 [Cercospora zeina]